MTISTFDKQKFQFVRSLISPTLITTDPESATSLREAPMTVNSLRPCKTFINLAPMKPVQPVTNIFNCGILQIKFSENTDRISAEDLTEIVTTVVTDWCTEIQRAVEFFYSTYPDDPIKTIFLSGGGGNIKKFRQLLATETTAKVMTINPFKAFYLDKNSFDSSYIKQIGPQAAICMGLATRRVDDK
jgi:Tfp pilus assembly PilM family ATPase